MNIREIYQNLGMTTDFDKEIERTNNRILCLLKDIDEWLDYDASFVRGILHVTGFNPAEYGNAVAELVNKSKDSIALEHNMLILQVLQYKVANRSFSDLDEHCDTVLLRINEIFSLAVLDIGYIYKDGAIIKSGARELDEKLIVANLDWLRRYPAARESFANSLKFYLSKMYSDSITNAYSSLEGMVKVVLNSSKALNKNNDTTIQELLKRLGLEQEWNQVVFKYCDIANEVSSRHGPKNQSKKDVSPELAEFYIYMTGTFLRLISQRIK